MIDIGPLMHEIGNCDDIRSYIILLIVFVSF